MRTPISRDEYVPIRRRVVGLYALLAIAAITGLIVLAHALRFDHPAAGPATPEVADAIDPLREDVPCELPAAREGEERPVAAAEPELPNEVTSTELYDCPTTWDGRRVRYVGEVVGAVLGRRDHAWVQLNDDVYADGIGPLPTHRDFRGGNAGVGARLELADAAAIEVVGGPSDRGDLVEVIGTFRRVDPESGEVAVVLVESLTLLRRGEPLEQPSHPARPAAASLAALACLVVVIAERRRREQ